MDAHINSQRRDLFAASETLIVKVGSRVLSTAEGLLDVDRVRSLTSQIAKLSEDRQVALVSSGAVAAGMAKLQLAERPADVAFLQAVASVGQASLMQVYEQSLSKHGRHAAQVLLTADDIDDRARYLNLRNTLHALFKLGAVPIINENDSVSVEELLTTFGDNDRLAAMVAGLFSRPALVILSDVDGVYTSATEARANSGNVVPQFDVVDSGVLELASSTAGGVGKGGMQSKLKAAQYATRSGAPVVIAGGRVPDVLPRLVSGQDLGTLFLPQVRSLVPKKRWIGFSAQVAGRIYCDQGATEALYRDGPSLLAIGIQRVEGSFRMGDVVGICDPSGNEFARGLTNYGGDELRKIAGRRSDAIAEILGHCPYTEVIHRDNLALMESGAF